MPRPTSAQILASQLEQAMAFYAAAKDSSPPSSSTQTLAPPQPASSSSSQATDTDTVQPIRSGNGTATGAKERDAARSGSLSRPTLPAHSLARPPLALEPARSAARKDDLDGRLTDDDDDDDLDEFGYGPLPRRNQGPKKESLIDILNSEPPPWMNQPPSSSSFSLDPVADPDNPKSSSSSSLTSKLRRRLRASTTTTSGSHGDSISGGGGGAVGLTTLRNSKSSTNLLIASLGRKARPSGGGGGRARANTGSSNASPKTRASHEFPDPPPPQMLPFDLPPLLIPPAIANITPTRTAASQTSTSSEKKKLARKSAAPGPEPSAAAAATRDPTRHPHENGPLEDATGCRRDASTEEEVLLAAAAAAAAGTSDAHDDFGASVQHRRETFSNNERSGPTLRPSESDKQSPSSASLDVKAAASSENDSPDRDRSSTRSPSERRALNSSPRRPVPEPLRTRAPLAELPPLRADSDESIISYASIQKSPTRGPMPRRISRKPTSSPSSTVLAAPSPLEAKPSETTTASARESQIDRAAEWTLSPTEEFAASPIVGTHHHHSPPSPVQAQSRGVQPGSTRTQTPPPAPRRRDSDQVRRRLQSLQEHISAFLLRSTDHADGRAAVSVIEVEVLAARLAEAGTVLRRSLAATAGDQAGSGSSSEFTDE